MTTRRVAQREETPTTKSSKIPQAVRWDDTGAQETSDTLKVDSVPFVKIVKHLTFVKLKVK